MCCHMQCYTEGFTKQYAMVAYHWVIQLYYRKGNSVQPTVTVHALFSLSYFVIVFLFFSSAKQVGVLMAVQPTSIYLILGKYT